jgi:adenylate cyclase
MATERIRRRLAAIPSADVAGYGRVLAADRAGTLAALMVHRWELIDQKKSTNMAARFVKLIGDGALAQFASVVDALECN